MVSSIVHCCQYMELHFLLSSFFCYTYMSGEELAPRHARWRERQLYSNVQYACAMHVWWSRGETRYLNATDWMNTILPNECKEWMNREPKTANKLRITINPLCSVYPVRTVLLTRRTQFRFQRTGAHSQFWIHLRENSKRIEVKACRSLFELVGLS